MSTLTFEYGSRTVWLLDLAADPVLTGYDLCSKHAERLTVPNGWERIDRRTSTPPLFVARRLDEAV